MDIEYDNKSISAITYTRSLGLTVNCLLTWTDHIDLLAKKTQQYMLPNMKC